MHSDRRSAPSRFAPLALLIGLATILIGAQALAAPATSATSTNTSAPAAIVRLVAAWVRLLPAGVPSGGYLILENRSERPLVLTGVSSPAFGEVDLHRTVSDHGVMSMRPVDRIVIAPHATLDFSVQGYHLMLMRPAHALAAGERVPIILHFEGYPDLDASAQVRTHE